MVKKKTSWFKRLLLPAAAALSLMGCATTGSKGLETPDFARSKTVSASQSSEESSKKDVYHPFKFYTGAKGTGYKKKSSGKAAAKAVVSPTQDLRIPLYGGYSYTEVEQSDGDTLATKIGRGGGGLASYLDIGNALRGYGELAVLGEGTEYREDVDLDLAGWLLTGKIGAMLEDLDMKIWLSGGWGQGNYEGIIGTTDLEDRTSRGYITLKGKGKIVGGGSISGFDQEEDLDSAESNGKEKGLYWLAGVGYDRQNFKDLVEGSTIAGQAGIELRDTLSVGEFELPYFIRLLGSLRQEEYIYPYAKDKRETFGRLGAQAGIKVCDFIWLYAEGGYDQEHHGYGGLGAQFSFGILPKKRK